MNKEYVLYNLKAAKKELDRTIKEIEEIEDYDYGEYSVAIQHLYHHLNTAWNAKKSSSKESNECSEENFKKWRQFPSDIYMGL